jgi:hypothetical protein
VDVKAGDLLQVVEDQTVAPHRNRESQRPIREQENGLEQVAVGWESVELEYA